MHKKRSLWARVSDFVTGSPDFVASPVTQAVPVMANGVRIPITGHTHELRVGNRRLYVSPDLPLTGDTMSSATPLLVFYPQEYFAGIAHFARLVDGATLTLDPNAEGAGQLFAYPGDVLRRSVTLRHEGSDLVIKAAPEPETYLLTVDEGSTTNALLARRRRALQSIREICADLAQPRSADNELAVLQRVTELLLSEPNRPRLEDGEPGGIVEIPATKTPIVVGDLHGQVDNLLTLLTHNAYLEGIARGDAALIILGDAVHPEDPNCLEQMDTSMLMMDLIFRLKLAFPASVYFLLGNHDSFSGELMKHGVPQGMVWDQYLTRMRGRDYRDEMARFYEHCSVMAKSADFVVCHAGAPRFNVTPEMFANARQHPELVHELTWNRQKTLGHAGGYTASDVSRLRATLGLTEQAAFIVGHYPRSETGSVWLDAGGVQRHHVVISSRSDEVGLITRIQGQFVAQTYNVERLVPWLDDRAGSSVDVGVTEQSSS